GQRRAEKEAGLHRESEPTHSSPHASARHRLGDGAEDRRLLDPGSEPADDLPQEERGDLGRGGGGDLRDGGQNQRYPEQSPDTELVDQDSGGQSKERGDDRAHREERD